MGPILVVSLLLAALVAALIYRWWHRKPVRGYLAENEYWVYVQETKLPPAEKMMDRMISANPHNRPGRPCIGAQEGMIFSDVRLHIAVALREKNPYAFRPDLFTDDVAPNAEQLDAIAAAKAIAKVRYASRAPLRNAYHLQFLPHLAHSLCDLMGGTAIYDRVSGSVWLADELGVELGKNNNANRPALHVNVVWVPGDEGTGHVRTRGLRKRGLPEVETYPVPADQEVIATGLMIKLAHEALRTGELPETQTMNDFDCEFIVELERAGPIRQARIKRKMTT